jgi:hypothetical protein
MGTRLCLLGVAFMASFYICTLAIYPAVAMPSSARLETAAREAVPHSNSWSLGVCKNLALSCAYYIFHSLPLGLNTSSPPVTHFDMPAFESVIINY